jgi:outer membrane protein TolC
MWRPGWLLAWRGHAALPAALLVAPLLTGLAGPAAAQEAAAEHLSQPEYRWQAPPPADQPLPAPPAGPTESLPALLARVLARDPQVRVAASLLQATQERRLQARSRLGPSLSLTANHGSSQETELGQHLERSTSRVEAGLRWNLYNSGNDLAELGGATRDVAAAAQDLRRAREDASERLAETYVELLRLQGLLPLAAERLVSVRQLVEQVRRQNEAGKASDADTTQAAASLLDAEIVAEQMRADYESARAKLAAQVGGEVRAVLPIVLQPAPGVYPATAAAGSDAGPQPGLVSAALMRAEAARERVRPAVSLLAPRIDLELRRQLSDRTFPAQVSEQQQLVAVVARWDFPVMGELSARRNETQRRAEAAEAEAERVARGVSAELQSLGPRISNAERSVAQLDQQIAQYNALVRAGELQFEAGRRSVAQLIALRESRYNAEQRRAEQAQRLLAARLRQLALNGGLLPALGLGSGIEDLAPP